MRYTHTSRALCLATISDSVPLQLQVEIRHLREENGQLSLALLEQGMMGAEDSLLQSVESSLRKFHSFLDLLEDVGYIDDHFDLCWGNWH